MSSHHFCRSFVALAGVALFGRGTAAFAQPGGPPQMVQVCPVTADEIPPSIRLVGTAIPDRKVTVASEVGGVVAKFTIRDGQRVRAGDVLCEVDSEPFRLRLGEARAALAALESRLLEAKNGPRAEEMARREASVAEFQAMVRKWDFERQRLEKLQKIGQSSEKEVHDAEMEYLAAERRRVQADASLEEGRNGTRAEVMAAWQAEVESQRARTALLERDAAKSTILAPFDGDVVMRFTEVGAWLETGGPVCDLIALDPIIVRADVPEAAVAYCAPGSPVSLEVEALGVRRTGVVARVVAQGSSNARTFPVEIEIPNADRALLPGMLAWTFVPSGPSGKRLMVSKDALVPDGQSRRIFVVRKMGEGEMAMPMNVITGLERSGLIEVQAPGLSEGDRVVCRANERLFAPTPVVALPFDPNQRGPMKGPHGAPSAHEPSGSSHDGKAQDGGSDKPAHEPGPPQPTNHAPASQPTSGSR